MLTKKMIAFAEEAIAEKLDKDDYYFKEE